MTNFRTYSLTWLSPFRISLLTYILLAVCACKPSPDEATDAAAVPQDKTVKLDIDRQVARLDSQVTRAGRPLRIAYEEYAFGDSIDLWHFDDGSARISMVMHQPRHLVWPTFFVVQGDLIKVRYREHKEFTQDTSAAEVMVYLRDNGIVYCEERSLTLGPGATPALVRLERYTLSSRTPDDIRSLYEPYWEEAMRVLKEANAWQSPPVDSTSTIE